MSCASPYRKSLGPILCLLWLSLCLLPALHGGTCQQAMGTDEITSLRLQSFDKAYSAHWPYDSGNRSLQQVAQTTKVEIFDASRGQRLSLGTGYRIPGLRRLSQARADHVFSWQGKQYFLFTSSLTRGGARGGPLSYVGVYQVGRTEPVYFVAGPMAATRAEVKYLVSETGLQLQISDGNRAASTGQISVVEMRTQAAQALEMKSLRRKKIGFFDPIYVYTYRIDTGLQRLNIGTHGGARGSDHMEVKKLDVSPALAYESQAGESVALVGPLWTADARPGRGDLSAFYDRFLAIKTESAEVIGDFEISKPSLIRKLFPADAYGQVSPGIFASIEKTRALYAYHWIVRSPAGNRYLMGSRILPVNRQPPVRWTTADFFIKALSPIDSPAVYGRRGKEQGEIEMLDAEGKAIDPREPHYQELMRLFDSSNISGVDFTW